MRREPHPLSGVIYEQAGDGVVRVREPGSDRYGLFSWRGEHLEGDITQADIHMLNYIGGPDLPLDHEVFWMAVPAVVHDGAAPVQAPPGAHMSEMPRIVAKYQADTGKQTKAGMRSAGHMELDVFLKADRRPELIPEAFHKISPMPGGPRKIGTERYHSKAFHDLEVEHLWKRAWQMACREDDIPNVGDYHVYQIAHLSYLVVRVSETKIKAYQNVCLHRGRILKDCPGKRAKEIRCPFHGWAWNLDGSLKEITTEWDFPGVREDVSALPEAKVGLWAGFVFINPDTGAGPLEDFLGPVMIDHYAKYKLQNRYKQAHVEKVVRANWKVVMEAFMESYHVIATHPHQMLVGGDLSNTRYDVFGNWGRAGHISMSNPGSPQRGMFMGEGEAIQHYHAYADMQRELLRSMIGDEVEQYSDAEVTDTGTFCDLFPNLHPWSGWARITFRFRPNGDNPDESIMDVLLLAPWPEGKPKPAPAKLRQLGADEPWTLAPELLSLSKIMDQDVGNLPWVQAGLKAKSPPHVWYSSYQEGKIRNFHRNYDRALGLKEDN
jgi:phenylpropionate dioxygenase-like ring-hydroxylating dioxygenase large terminal subunit